MIETCTENQIRILQHSLGISENKRIPYRNHFVAGPGHDEMGDLEALESMGLVKNVPGSAFLHPGDMVFRVTERGEKIAIENLPEPRKLTKYDEYLQSDVDGSFGEWLIGWAIPEFVIERDKWRMIRKDRYGCVQVSGEPCKTKKEAKASYKSALKAYHQGETHEQICEISQ